LTLWIFLDRDHSRENAVSFRCQQGWRGSGEQSSVQGRNGIRLGEFPVWWIGGACSADWMHEGTSEMKRTMGLHNSQHFAGVTSVNGVVLPVFLQGWA
jgi:hypothetical protein